MINKGYDTNWLETLKSRNDIVSTISRYIHLEKKGRNFWGRCPFHNERTPSFSVNETEQFYHCFGCGESGDVIKFVEKFESVDFPEAVKILAKNAGMEVPEVQNNDEILKKKKAKEKSLEILEIAKDHYKENLLLPKAKPAQDYIKMRGLGGRELRDFELGFSIDWGEMVDYLKKRGYSSLEIKEAGISEMKDGREYDVFGGRLIFPIFNTFGDCVGFSGRILVKSDFAKYKNSAQNIVFDKSKLVYGLSLVKKLKQVEQIDRIILVEGQMDVIAMHKGGFKTAVASLGTALTASHAREIKRINENVIVCYDGDYAGQKATLRSLDILKNEGLNVLVATLPDSLDPDEILKQRGKSALEEILDNALPINDYRLAVVEKKYDLSKASEKSQYLKDALDVIRLIDSPSERDAYLSLVRDKTLVPIDVLRREIGQAQSKKVFQPPKESDDIEKRENSSIKATKFILASLLFKKEFASFEYDISPYLVNSSHKKLYQFMLDKVREGKPISVSAIFDNFDAENDLSIKEIVSFQFSSDEDNDKKYYFESLWSLKENLLKDQKNKLTEDFKKSSDANKRREIAAKLTEISKQLMKKSLEE